MKLRDIFLSALYPDDVACCICSREALLNEHGLCTKCAGLLIREPGFSIGDVVDGWSAGLVYNDSAADMIHRFKYYGCRYLGKNLASFMGLPPHWQADGVIPVPLHAERMRERGYNQSLVLANEIAERSHLPVMDKLIKRTRNTPMQSMTSHEERRKNVKGAFRGAKGCKGLNIVLVDDVITTGSTMEECAMALKAAGAEKVYAIAACYAGAQES